ncbi:uncharacterized protein LOC130727535 [Lotus japonicus]|uniref:uncharacterized protein LOC130727535 n=1 Tax=Lotus japonicus TaxID=34305 RepID=UPI002585006B|nr:uncharacterized protein LOC130727535 [Lotus japonicus]
MATDSKKKGVSKKTPPRQKKTPPRQKRNTPTKEKEKVVPEKRPSSCDFWFSGTDLPSHYVSSHLRQYAAELLRSNPGSTVIIKSAVGVHGPVFERIYVCFEATKTAFAKHCRPLIGLDGCFLKGLYGGQLLSAVGKDGNNQMFPIAFAVVEAETKDSWTWFLNILLHDMNSVKPQNWAFISDQQKGLVPAIAELSQDTEHRLCVKHLYSNFRKRFPREELKNALWAAARASTEPQWKNAMDNMKELNQDAWLEMMHVCW